MTRSKTVDRRTPASELSRQQRAAVVRTRSMPGNWKESNAVRRAAALWTYPQARRAVETGDGLDKREEGTEDDEPHATPPATAARARKRSSRQAHSSAHATPHAARPRRTTTRHMTNGHAAGRTPPTRTPRQRRNAQQPANDNSTGLAPAKALPRRRVGAWISHAAGVRSGWYVRRGGNPPGGSRAGSAAHQPTLHGGSFVKNREEGGALGGVSCVVV